jgi:integrase/recombinase XerD
MTKQERAKRAHRHRKSLPASVTSSCPTPLLEDYLSTCSSFHLTRHMERLLGSRSLVREIEQRKGRLSLQYYLRPLDGLELPGKQEFVRHVQEKYRANFKPNTLTGTVVCGKLFLSFLKGTGKDRLDQLTRMDLEAFVEQEQDRGMKPRTVRSRLAVVRAFVRFLERERIVGPEVLSRTLCIKLPENLPRAMEPEDVGRLLEALTDTRERALILVLLRTGMRIGELLDTKVADVHLAQRRIEIPQASKTSVGRVVYLSNDARDALKAYMRLRDSRTVYLFHAQGSPIMTYSTARAVFKKSLAKAGLEDKGYGLHRLRHTFASEMLNAGMRLECLGQLLGHSTIEMTRRYARLTDITREEGYFKAMQIIEQGGIHGHYQLDPELQAVLEEKKLLRPYRKAVSERSEAVSSVGRCTD